MNSLETTLNNIKTIPVFETIIKDIQEDITFFGWRYVYIRNYDGRLHIDILAKRVIQIVNKKFYNNRTDRLHEVEDLVDSIYKNNFDRTKTKMIVTRIFCMVRDWFERQFGDYGTRWQWKNRRE